MRNISEQHFYFKCLWIRCFKCFNIFYADL